MNVEVVCKQREAFPDGVRVALLCQAWRYIANACQTLKIIRDSASDIQEQSNGVLKAILDSFQE